MERVSRAEIGFVSCSKCVLECVIGKIATRDIPRGLTVKTLVDFTKLVRRKSEEKCVVKCKHVTCVLEYKQICSRMEQNRWIWRDSHEAMSWKEDIPADPMCYSCVTSQAG